MTNKNPIVDALLNAGKDIYVEYQKQQKQAEQPRSTPGIKTLELTSSEVESLRKMVACYGRNTLLPSYNDHSVMDKVNSL